jgi:aspartyl-tRNA(Asn)/glutamyl-tRNA(Gln) amidotransferase subunit A
VAPTSPFLAWPFGERLADPLAMYLADVCTLPANMAGLPGISTPCGLAEGLPVGLQLIGSPWSEVTLLRAARAYEAITADAPWRHVRPRDLDRLTGPDVPVAGAAVTA